MVEMCSKSFLVDAGEGTQINMQRIAVKQARMDNIFISHLHGDHCFGLIGLISTLGMLGRTRSLTIHAHADLEKLLRPMLDYFCKGMAYEVNFHHIDPYKKEVIYDDRTMTVTSLPLKHRVPCCGFLFSEKQRPPHIIPQMFERYNIPLAMIPAIKDGEDYLTADGQLIPNQWLTRPSSAPISYAYCSDTAYSERLVEWVRGVDCLYHEATYMQEHLAHAKKNMHSTAIEAATIAKKAGVGQLLIGHYSSRIKDEQQLLAEAKQVFENTRLTYEGMVVEI